MVAFIPHTNTALRYVDSFGKVIAGAESNTAIGLAKLGCSTGWFSKVGNDEFGEFVIREIRGEGVDTSRVIRDSEHPTGIMFKQFAENKESSVFYYRKDSAASTLSPADIDPVYIADTRILMISGITPALSESCQETIRFAIHLARENGVQVCFDPNIRRKLWNEVDAKKVLEPILSQSDIVCLGMNEASLLTGETTPENAARNLRDRGALWIGIKLGSEGAYVADQHRGIHIPAYPISVIDNIGAGDAFNAGFLFGILEKKNLEDCGRLGTIMGALAVSTYGDIEGLPNRTVLEKLATGFVEATR